MTMHTTHDHRAAFALQQVGAAVLAALALWALLALLSGLYQAVAMRSTWVQVNAVYAGLGGDGLMEVELHPDDAAKLPALPPVQHPAPYQPDHLRVLLPERPYTWLNLAQPVVLAVRPATPPQVVLVDALADATMALAQAVGALVLGGLAWALRRRLDWGRDATWDGAGWSTAALTAWPPGAQAVQGQVLQEARSRRRWAAWLTGLFAALLLGNLIGIATEQGESSPIAAAFSTLLLALVVSIGLYQVVFMRTRRVQWDDAGAADTSWFGTRRVPWRAIARWQRENTAAAAQERYDRQSLSSRKGRRRPVDHWVWAADAAGGERVLQVDESMEPPDALAALRQRVERVLGQDRLRASGGGPAAVDDDEVEPTAEERAQWQQHEAAFDEMQARTARSFRWGYVVVVAPFLLMFLWPTWSAIGYQFLAERVEGVVMAAEPGTEVPQLTVQYPAPDGRSLELRTDGSRANQGIAVGSRITVLRPRTDPEDAKIAGFWAVWIWPVITGVLLLIVALPFYVGFIHGPRREARERAARKAGG